MTHRPESAQTGRTAVNAVKQVLNETQLSANEFRADHRHLFDLSAVLRSYHGQTGSD
jgi:hypothetical protein